MWAQDSCVSLEHVGSTWQQCTSRQRYDPRTHMPNQCFGYLSLSLSVRLPLSLSLSLCPCLTDCLPVSLSLSLSLSRSPSLALWLPGYLSYLSATYLSHLLDIYLHVQTFIYRGTQTCHAFVLHLCRYRVKIGAEWRPRRLRG